MAKIIVYTTDSCPYCDAAKSLLNSLSMSFEEINITNDDEKRVALVSKTGHRTLPQIFIDDEFVGGYMELKSHLNK